MARLTVAFSLDGQTTTPIPAAFFSDLGRQGFIDLMLQRRGVTNTRETRHIWRLLQRPDVPPKNARLIIEKTELLNLYPAGSPPTGSLASALDALWGDVIEN